MNTNKILLAGLLGGVVNFFLGWLVYGILLSEMLAPPAEIMDVVGKPLIMWAIAFSCLIYGLMLAYIFGHWAGISTVASGATGGAIIGAMTAGWVNFSLFSMYKLNTLQTVVLDIIVATIVSAIVGAAVAWMLGRGKAAG